MANIDEIYEKYIKPLSPIEQRRLMALISRELALRPKGEASSSDDSEPLHDLLELEGLGAEIWEGVDAQEYVNALRDEWEHRP